MYSTPTTLSLSEIFNWAKSPLQIDLCSLEQNGQWQTVMYGMVLGALGERKVS